MGSEYEGDPMSRLWNLMFGYSGKHTWASQLDSGDLPTSSGLEELSW